MNPKRLLLLLPLAAFASCSTQPSKHTNGMDFQSGDWRLSGDLSYASNGSGTVNGESVGLGGSIGYFVNEAVEVGLGGDFETVNVKSSVDDLENTYLSLFGRYYTSSVGATRPFAELGLGLGTTSIGAGEIDLNVITGAVGMIHFLDDAWAVELALENTYYLFPSDPNPNSTSWAGVLGISVFF
jgi:hypothetical protein